MLAPAAAHRTGSGLPVYTFAREELAALAQFLCERRAHVSPF